LSFPGLLSGMAVSQSVSIGAPAGAQEDIRGTVRMTECADPVAVVTEEKPAVAASASQRVSTLVKKTATQNFIPGCVTVCIGGIILVLYNTVGGVKDAFEAVSDVRDDVGVSFGAASTAFWAGTIPALVLWMTGVLKGTLKRKVVDVVYLTVLWASIGVLVHYFYELQEEVFGDGTDFLTILQKVIVDQFILNPFVAQPYFFCALRYRDVNYNCAALCETLRHPMNVAIVIAAQLVAVWCTWIPGTSLIYLMPTELQLILQNILCVFFSILLSMLSANSNGGADSVAAPTEEADQDLDEKKPGVP